MSYLLGAYGVAVIALAGYVVYLARQSKAAAASIRDLDRDR